MNTSLTAAIPKFSISGDEDVFGIGWVGIRELKKIVFRVWMFRMSLKNYPETLIM